MVRITEIVKTADDVHACFQGFCFANQGAGFAGQAIEPLAKSGIEPFDESSIDHSLPLGLVDQSFNHLLSTLDNPAGDGKLALGSLFDDLHDGDIGPGKQLGTSLFAPPTGYSRAKRIAKGSHIAGQTIYGQKQRSTQGHRFDLIGQSLDQIQIPMNAHRTS